MGVQKSKVSSLKKKLKRKIILKLNKNQNHILLKNIKKKNFLNMKKFIVYRFLLKNLDIYF